MLNPFDPLPSSPSLFGEMHAANYDQTNPLSATQPRINGLTQPRNNGLTQSRINGITQPRISEVTQLNHSE